jgi:hypothetical protein
VEAPLNTGVTIATNATRARLTPTGGRPSAIVAAAAASSRYPPTMTGRGRSRSASAPSSVPPMTCGTNPIPNVTAVRNAEPVDANTSTDRARMRRVSAAIASDRLRNSSRNTGSAKTSR